MNEVKLFEQGGYVPTKDGHIWSQKRRRYIRETIGKDGYVRVVVSVEGKVSCHLLHRVIATAFIPNDDNLPEVNHKDENKLNNCVDNLEWCSSKYNSNYGN